MPWLRIEPAALQQEFDALPTEPSVLPNRGCDGMLSYLATLFLGKFPGGKQGFSAASFADNR